MHKVLFSFASSKDSMDTIVSLNVRWCCPACRRRWKNYQCCLPAAPQCLAASSIHICLNSGCRLHVLAHLRFQPGGTQIIPSYSLDYSPQSSPGQWTSDYLLCVRICVSPVQSELIQAPSWSLLDLKSYKDQNQQEATLNNQRIQENAWTSPNQYTLPWQ